ncbi:MAG: hypothetical protein EBY22_13475 [Gammaproteobacteria bacterium]|nr:hypothetical protein [Gammaproteobacteria bacterium]
MRILDGAEAHKTVDLESFDKPALFTVDDTGPAPQISSVRTAAYREPGMTAAERAEARREGELRSAAMAHIQSRERVPSNNGQGLVPVLAEVVDTRASLEEFWGITRVPEEHKKSIVRRLEGVLRVSAYRALGSANRVISKNAWNATFPNTIELVKIKIRRANKIDPELINWSAPFSKYENLELLEPKRAAFYEMLNNARPGPPSRGSSVSSTLSLKNSNNNNNNSTNGVVGNNFSPRSPGGGRRRKTRKSNYRRR